MNPVRLPSFLFHLMLSIALAGATLYTRPVLAGVVSTEDVAASAKAADARAQLQALVKRPELAKELQLLGIAPQEAAGRVAAMTDAEVFSLAGKLGAVPAGGAMTNTELLIVILLIVLVALAL